MKSLNYFFNVYQVTFLMYENVDVKKKQYMTKVKRDPENC